MDVTASVWLSQPASCSRRVIRLSFRVRKIISPFWLAVAKQAGNVFSRIGCQGRVMVDEFTVRV